MSEREEDGLTLLERRVRAALHAVETPQPDPDFRVRLKQAFVSGRITETTGAERSRGGEPARPDIRAPWQGLGRPALRWGLAVASAVAMLFVVAGLNRGPAWEVRSIAGQGVAVIDGRPVPLNHDEEIAAMIRPGARVRVPDGAGITLASAGSLAFEMTSGTDAVVPASPGRWFGRAVRSEVQSGNLRITTGERFRGAQLMVRTPAADVRVVGTTLAVICEPEGTCVCVLEGTVEVGPRGGRRAAVPHGMRRFVYLDDREPVLDEIRADEAVTLDDFRENQRRIMGAR